MSARAKLAQALKPALSRVPAVKELAKRVDEGVGVVHHSLAARFPSLIRPRPRQITLAVTAQCNLRCHGCRYGRDFMVGERLPLDLVLRALADARAAGVLTARFFGGEPLLHPDLPAMIRGARELGLEPYITSNAVLLGRRLDELYDAGLRWMTMGFYGVGDAYDDYTGRPGSFSELRESLTALRARFDAEAFALQLNFVLTTRSASLEALRAAWDFAREFDLHLSVDPVSETIPFFTDPDEDLVPRSQDRGVLEELSRALLRFKRERPDRVPPSDLYLRAIPDLVLENGGGTVPCDAYQLIWVGANGDVQLCDTAFPLGNLHEQPLAEVLFGEEHERAARDGFALRCPGCLCKIDSRLRKHAASRRAYGKDAPA